MINYSNNDDIEMIRTHFVSLLSSNETDKANLPKTIIEQIMLKITQKKEASVPNKLETPIIKTDNEEVREVLTPIVTKRDVEDLIVSDSLKKEVNSSDASDQAVSDSDKQSGDEKQTNPLDTK